ncbi:MAG: hypothetical protein LIO77_05820 [Rikenellaceae bacterium]|nr:hypothetical protein [Rikenellaceae bacterium]
MRKKLLLLLAFASFAALYSCSDDKDTEIEENGYENPADAASWFYKGTMEVAPVDESGSVYYWENQKMKLVFDDDRKTCNLVMYQANFAEDMPVTLDIVVNGMAVSQTTTGYTITGDNIIPLYYNGRTDSFEPYPKYIMTAISINAAADAISLSLTCGDYPVTFLAPAYEATAGEKDNFGEDFDE